MAAKELLNFNKQLEKSKNKRIGESGIIHSDDYKSTTAKILGITTLVAIPVTTVLLMRGRAPNRFESSRRDI